MKRLFLGAAASIAILAAPLVSADDPFEDRPSAEAIVFDLAIARPVGLVSTIVGAVIFVIALPVSITIGQPPSAAAKRLVLEPFAFTFTRPLGDY